MVDEGSLSDAVATLSNAAIARTGTVSRVMVTLTSGPDAGSQTILGSRPIVVGASDECDLVLADEHVSRRHAKLAIDRGGVLVEDLRSTNGVLYQGSRLSKAVLPLGAVIKLGDSSIELHEAPRAVLKPSARTSFGGMIGQSSPMREIFAILERASPSDATIVLEGESGTGKEVAARSIHNASKRADAPFAVVDCSAIPTSLIDSHLFGHTKGAFTGAVSDRAGAFASAQGGTVFLDEIAELPLGFQAKLLRVLEEGSLQSVGSDRRVAVDARVVVATHRSLRDMVAAGTFRFDLFYRLAVVHVRLPALRERPEDIALLVERFYQLAGLSPGPVRGPNLELLQAYAWPGNARELRNTLERAWALTPGDSSCFQDLELWPQVGGEYVQRATFDARLPFRDARQQILDDFERRYLAEVWERYDRNVSHAAKHAGIDRKYLRELLQRHGLYR